MKEETSTSSPPPKKMIDGNWVLKRKRKRISCRSDLSRIKESVSAVKPIPSVSRSGQKIKGNDGYYYECEECNLGGSLLCCDSCPRTYHLECLKPPLKRPPHGKWHCPSCSEEKNPVNVTNNLDSGSKRARTKVSVAKPTAEIRSSGPDTKLTSERSSSPVIYRGTIKGKSVISQKHLAGVNNSDQSNRTSTAVEKKSSQESPQNLDADGTKNYTRTSSDVTKNGSLGNKRVPSLDQSVQKARKQRPKLVKESEKDQAMLLSVRKASTNTEVLRARQKRSSSAVHRVPSFVENSEGTPERVSNASTLMIEGKNAADKVREHDPTFQDILQVDRILGCRVKGTGTSSSSPTKASSKTIHASVEENPVTDRDDVDMLDVKDCNAACQLSFVKDDDVSPPELVDRQSQTKDNSLERSENPLEESVGEHSEDVLEGKNGNSEANTCQKDPPQSNTMEEDGKLGESSEVTYEFFVKWVGQSNIHNCWIPESQLKVLAKRKLENYKAKYGTSAINICQEQWTLPQRVIGIKDLKSGIKEAFVKWRGLPYDECTWERLDEPIIKNCPQLVAEFNRFESQALQRVKVNTGKVNREGQDLSPLLEQPKELEGGSLFPHQLEALNWLRKCWHKSKNVILADEMGLGKTVSACAFISSLYCEFKARLPCLVLVPLSTMPNWLAEFSLWAPHLNVVEYHGCARARSTIRAHEWHPSDSNGQRVTSSYKFNVLLTTYEMVLADASHLRGVSWEVLVVDEGHRLKNSGSKLFGLLNTISFQHRVLLTGTPLQNNIGEMYNLLNFLQPATFPSLSAFEEKFNDLTTAEKVEELKKLVSPHMLRRLKKDAMQNIPPKTERMAPVELTSIQAEYYRAMLTKNYQILRNIGKGVAQQSMLNIVMQLRKVCNHPYLIPGTEPDSGSPEFLQEMRIKASGKLALLHSMLKILYKEGHRVLIFSQMTKLLDILEDYLTMEYGSKSFERVDGSVSVADRQTAIARFNQDKSRFVFLLSTRSCGLGINLATADTVVIYDSDFNPHADIQAMNRAHRIGQSNRLLVYRLVVRASVEERILQLAKKKLMLDQLFVNKSETQKEVEDILRWGTEELFGETDQNDACNPKLEGVAEGEPKSRRRSGGLGDVYQDRCMDVGNKIVWDETAIMKLLDRSNLQAGASENVDVDSENDMLGSVKSMEWNDDVVEEQGGAETNDTVQTFDVKEDSTMPNTEENEWDRLLRVRWERYQNEEEASLGRGKRLRKAVSYKESFAQIASEALSESGNEEDEPVPEYTPAGRAFKAKFTKLRARQKERIARRNIPEVMCLAETVPAANEGDETQIPSKPRESSLDQIPPSDDSPEKDVVQPPEAALKNRSSSRSGRAQKHENPNPTSNSDHLPVLGLCAPNAHKLESTSQNFHTFLSMPVHSIEERQRMPPEVPFPSFKDRSALMDGSPMLPENLFSEAFNRHMKSIAPGNGFPFNPDEASSSMLPGLEESLRKFPFPRLVPSLSLDTLKAENLPDSPAFPPLPIFTNSREMQQAAELPLLGHMLPPSLPLLPENHRKVLDSIMMRTGGSGGAKVATPPKRRSKIESWTEDELDALWIGVRRHGHGNWEAMLRDPKLKLSKHRLPEELSSRWAMEQVKILSVPSTSTATSSAFPSLSDGMMTRALIGSRFTGSSADLPKFHSHLTDIQLGCGQTENLGPSASKSMPFATWQPEKVLSKSLIDLAGGPSTETKTAGGLASGKSNAGPDGSGGSSTSTLPHWLREVVNLQSMQFPLKKLELPPTAVAIAQSVRVLYGSEKSTIPPFIVPSQLPLPPKDPRKRLKKKVKLPNKLRPTPPSSSDAIAASSLSPALPLPPLPETGEKEVILSEREGTPEAGQPAALSEKGSLLDVEGVRERNWEKVVESPEIEMEGATSVEDRVSKDNVNENDL